MAVNFLRFDTRIRLLVALVLAIGLWWLAWSLLGRGSLPPTGYQPLPDFSRYHDIREMKLAFYDYLQPMVERQNAEIAQQRARLLEAAERIQRGESLSSEQQHLVEELAVEYRMGDTGEEAGSRVNRLLRRVDTIPLELALVQAAKESGWGKSRFAIDANNLFGQWCYEPGCGLVPSRRSVGKAHEVKQFDSVEAAIADYLLNLNTHPRYRPMREIRAHLRSSNVQLTGMALADGLLHYSERRQAYVDELKSMIRQYRRLAQGSKRA